MPSTKHSSKLSVVITNPDGKLDKSRHVKVLEAAGWRVGDAKMFVGECGACVVVGHNAPDGVLPDAPIYLRQPRPEGCEDCSGCPDCYTNEKPCDCRDADEMITRPVSA